MSASACTGRAPSRSANRVDLTAGARVDHETKDATLTHVLHAGDRAAARTSTAEESFSNVSPQFSAVVPAAAGQDGLRHRSAAASRRAASTRPRRSGSEAYGEEHTWNVEGGLKTTWAGGRVTANAAVFRIDWDDLQLNLPDPAVPAQFYIANVGGATSTRRRGRGERPCRAGRGTVHAPRVHACAVQGRAASSSGVERRRQRHAEHARLHGHVRRAGVARSGGPMRRSTAARRSRCYGAFQYDEPEHWRGRTPTRWPTSAPACAAASCLPKPGCATRSTRTTCRWRLRSAHSRRPDSSARGAPRGRSA